MGKARTVLVLGATSDKLFAVGTFILALNKSNKLLFDDIIVFYDTMTDEQQRKFAAFDNVITVEYKCPFENEAELSYFVKDLYTLMVYSKYECFKLLDKYDIVVWMDYDMYILDDVSELLLPVKEGVKAIVTRSVKDSLVGDGTIPGIDTESVNGFHSSVFVLDRNLKQSKEVYDFCIEQTVALKDYLMCPEQAIMALAFKHFDISVYPLDFRIYSNSFDGHNIYDRYVKIYHTYGKNKFWNGIRFAPWEKCFKEWNCL